MKFNGCSDHHQNNNLKVVIAFAKYHGPDSSFYDIKKKEQIIAYLDSKIKSTEQDPDKKWITTWNHYLHRIKLFLRLLVVLLSSPLVPTPLAFSIVLFDYKAILNMQLYNF
jgi:hypothetical protein